MRMEMNRRDLLFASGLSLLAGTRAFRQGVAASSCAAPDPVVRKRAFSKLFKETGFPLR